MCNELIGNYFWGDNYYEYTFLFTKKCVHVIGKII